MSRPDADRSIAGGWLGTYYYRSGRQPPVRFEATFTTNGPGGVFVGTILDDGPLGEAVVSHGLQSGPNVRFTKTYMRAPSAPRVVAPVHYLGTLSEDGDSLTGTWDLKARHGDQMIRSTGRWEARRLWGGSEAENAVTIAEPAEPALALR